MLNKYNLLVMLFVISAGFCLLFIVTVFNPYRLKEGESLCLNYKSFYEREIKKGKIELIQEIINDHGALEIHIIEKDTSYSIRIYEPIYDSLSLEGNYFKKHSNSYKLELLDGSIYKVIRTCDLFF
jgi:hypothetical protein